jgi:hypothetical protein
LHTKKQKIEEEICDKFEKVTVIKGEFNNKKLIRDCNELKNMKSSFREEIRKVKYDYDLKKNKGKCTKCSSSMILMKKSYCKTKISFAIYVILSLQNHVR